VLCCGLRGRPGSELKRDLDAAGWQRNALDYIVCALPAADMCHKYFHMHQQQQGERERMFGTKSAHSSTWCVVAAGWLARLGAAAAALLFAWPINKYRANPCECAESWPVVSHRYCRCSLHQIKLSLRPAHLVCA
jgi:hypothetical protein